MANTNRDEKMKEITDRLQAGLEELFNSEKYAEYLRVMSQFHHYSFNNTLLIAMQKPDATLVAGYHAWEKKFNRHVMKGEKGIQIIAPAPFKEKQEQEKIDPETGEVMLREDGQPETEEVTIVIPRFKVSTVFDLSQTDGDPLPELGPGELTASVENYEVFMNAIRSIAPVPIRFDEIRSGAKGYYDNANKEIVIQNGMSEMQTMKTAVHETAHAILHDKDIMQEQGIQKDQMTREVEAESVAFVSLAHFVLDTSDYSFPYIAGWSSGRDTKELKASLDTIRKTSSEIIDGIEASMREQMRELQEPEQFEEQVMEQIAAEREAVLKEEFESVELFDVPMLFSNGRVKQEALPPGMYCYDLRGSDYDPGSPLRLEVLAVVNHAGTILTRFPINLDELGYLRLGEELNFTDGPTTLQQYLEDTRELDPVAQQEAIENAIGYANENLYLDGAEDRYAIYQLKDSDELQDIRFVNTQYLAEHDLAVEGSNYDYIYGGRLSAEETLDSIYERFNLRHPEGFMGHSLSVSDVVIIQRVGEARAYYVDSVGFTEIEDFVEQRMLIAQKEQRVEDAYINMNTMGVFVDGHEGMWRPLYGQEINGDMFYLMESEEYGNEVANILLHMDGDLVAEDLWNGIDYVAMEAVKEYFIQNQISYSPAEFPLQERYSIYTEIDPQGKTVFFIVDNVTGGPLGEHGDVQTYTDRAKLAEQVKAMNQEKPAVYYESEIYAREHDQLDAYRFSIQENRACKEGIERVIRENFDGMHLDRNVIQPVIARFGAERVAYVLANTLQLESWDGRYSKANLEWASSVMENSEQAILDEILALPISSLPQNYLNVALEDDPNSPYGGTTHSNETFGEFLESAELPEEASIRDAHLSLQECGIKSPFESTEFLYENTLRSPQRNDIEERVASLRESRRSFFVSSHPTVLDGFTDYFRKAMKTRGLELDGSKPEEKPFIDRFYVVEDLEVHGQLAIKEYPTCEEALTAYFSLPNNKLKALGIQNTNPLPGSLDFIHCVNGIDTAIMDYTFVEVWNNPEVQKVQEEIENALALHDTEIAYDLSDGFITVKSVESGYEYRFYDLNYDCETSGVIETAVDGEPAKSLEGAVREIGDKLGISFDDWIVTDHQKLVSKINEHEEARMQEATQEEPAISVKEPDELAIGYDAGFITVQRTDNGYDYTIFNLKCRPIDCGVLEDPDLSIHEAMTEILNSEGLDDYNTWGANIKTIMAEAGETEIEHEPKAPTIAYFIAENIEFPVMGEYHEAASLSEAIKLFEDNPEGKLTGIGISLEDGNFPLVQRVEGMTKMTDLVSDNPIVQKAFEEAKQHFQEGRVTEYHPREAQELEPVVEQRTVELTLATPLMALEPTEKQAAPVDKTGGRKESVLKALRERQAQIKEREKQAPEQKDRERKKGEQTL